jgi:hypothetical protein
MAEKNRQAAVKTFVVSEMNYPLIRKAVITLGGALINNPNRKAYDNAEFFYIPKSPHISEGCGFMYNGEEIARIAAKNNGRIQEAKSRLEELSGVEMRGLID